MGTDTRLLHQPFAGEYPTEAELHLYDSAAAWVHARASIIVETLFPEGYLFRVDDCRAIGYHEDGDALERGTVLWLPIRNEWFLCSDQEVAKEALLWMEQERRRQKAIEDSQRTAAQKAAEYRAREERRMLYAQLAAEFGPRKSALEE